MEKLFRGQQLSEVLEQKLERALRDVHNLSDEELLSRDSDSMADEITDRFLLEPIELDREDVEVRREKTTFRPTRDFDRSAPPVSGLAVSYFVPFTGSKGLLDCRPSTFTSRYPQAEVRAEELIFIFLTRGPIAETADELTDQLDLVEEYLDWQGPDVEAFNEELDERIRSAVLERIEEAEEAEADLDDLGCAILSSGTTTAPSPPQFKAIGVVRLRNRRRLGVRRCPLLRGGGAGICGGSGHGTPRRWSPCVLRRLRTGNSLGQRPG